MMNPEDILRFWYEEAGPSTWFKDDPIFDATIRHRFGAIHAQAIAGELFEWRGDATGRLAEIIVLDQFSRNLFRNSPLAFQADPTALVLAQEAVSRGLHETLGDRKPGILMPYMHSESKRVHEEAVVLFAGTPSYEYEIRHKEIIDRFGRYKPPQAA